SDLKDEKTSINAQDLKVPTETTTTVPDLKLNGSNASNSDAQNLQAPAFNVKLTPGSNDPITPEASIVDITIYETNLDAGSYITGGIDVISSAMVPFASFLPLITEVTQVFNEIIKIYQSAEHNKKICGILLDRVQIADTAVRNLKNRRDENVDFFSANNLINLQNLVYVVGKIRKLVEDISKLTGLAKYIQAKNLEKTVQELSSEFDSTINVLQFSLTVDFTINADKAAKDNEIIKSDIKEFYQYLEDIGSGVTDGNKMISTILKQLYELNKTLTEPRLSEKQANTEGFRSELIKFSDFEEENLEVADRNSNQAEKDNFRKQVTILKKLESCRCIIQFFGLTANDDKFFLVTEWADNGNLREFYKQHGKLKVKLKLSFALDIAKGLNFLSSASIVHRDIRAENILITDRKLAKISNFKSSRAITDGTSNQAATLEAVRYCAPEKLEKGKTYKYDTKCEVYSFGILLWEIAEEKIPYEKYGNDIIVITELVCTKKFRESFSLGTTLPKEYQDLAKKGIYMSYICFIQQTYLAFILTSANLHLYLAVDHDHNFRPQFSKIFTILQELYKKDVRHTPSHSPKITPTNSETLENDINFSERLMSVDEAAKQHKLTNGDRELAYKCFEANAKLNDMKAKYFKAYYIQQSLVRLDMDQPTKDKLVADLYKEVADSGDPEAQLRYGNCLFKGVGVKKDLKKAAEYFTKAAESGQVVGMYNAATLYFSDNSGLKNEVLGEKYMRLAAYKQHKQAIDYYNNKGLPLVI
ncbi:873_t:CDS:10, partial [Funneliformis geosporum]